MEQAGGYLPAYFGTVYLTILVAGKYNRGMDGDGFKPGDTVQTPEVLPIALPGHSVVVGDGKPPEITKVGKKNFAAIYIEGGDGKAGEVVRLSDQEAVVLRAFLKSHSYEAAAKEAGIKKDSVQRMLRRPALKKFLMEVVRKAAIMEGVDASWAIKELIAVWEGVKKPSQMQMEAMKQIGKIITPKGPGIVIQQNSIYATMSKEDINAQWVDARTTATDGI